MLLLTSFSTREGIGCHSPTGSGVAKQLGSKVATHQDKKGRIWLNKKKNGHNLGNKNNCVREKIEFSVRGGRGLLASAIVLILRRLVQRPSCSLHVCTSRVFLI